MADPRRNETTGNLVAYLAALHMNDCEGAAAMRAQLEERPFADVLTAVVNLFARTAWSDPVRSQDEGLALLVRIGATTG